ncbi:hypothetical protein D9V84_10530 [Bacteroidetes/Chlorobi group bacterium Naka2016]|jgi:hypothetical protein|nr:MAG: hypothetical protein D9V84_10530 [Bacteroidetes/Chlorobi group bacterium Naka2016]
MNEVFELEYYDGDGVKTIPIHLKFLTPKLRVKIVQHDTASQLAFKKFEKEVLNKETLKKETEIQNKINKRIEQLKKNNPNLTEEEIEFEKTKFLLEIIKDISEEELKEREETLIKNWTYNDEWNIKLFQIIVDSTKLNEEQKELIFSDPGSEFWINANIGRVVDINRYFRRTYSL